MPMVCLLASAGLSAPRPADAASGPISAPVEIHDIVLAPGSTRDGAAYRAALSFYEFWNSGDREALSRAIAPAFADRTLPPGRPQGPTGPAVASEQFRAAVPDLRVVIEKMIVAGDYVTTHMTFSGHFTGHFGPAGPGGVDGHGQAIAFRATDLVKVTDGLITDNWHIEDNLTLLRQMGIPADAPSGDGKRSQ
ncbi:MAG: ester cyclase [Telmatospirillum sp.]|nr:ester cyclase [Telmatospirillum sp.]